MIKDIMLLDCTLRDGSHLNKGKFGGSVIKYIIEDLVKSGVNIIEVGFYDNESHALGDIFFSSIEEVRHVLPSEKRTSSFCLMADYVDVSGIEPCDGTVEYFRLSFKRHRWEWAIKAARQLIEKGYKVYINPVNCNVYTDEEYLQCIQRVNELAPYGFSIVDTFGVLRKQDLSRLYFMVERNLDKDITIGLHLHENLGLAYSLAQHFLEIRSPQRRVSIDASLLGMGRAPGNLCTEQIMDHLNYNFGMDYDTEPALDAIDDFIAPLKKQTPWGYAIPYALSGKYGLHRTYAEYLMGKNRLKTKDIQRILSQVDRNHIEIFDELYIETLYRKYMSSSFDDSESIALLRGLISGKRILIICPGSSINAFQAEILSFSTDKNITIFSVNFVPNFLSPTFVFCANMKRINNIRYAEKVHRIITSNIIDEAAGAFESVVSYNDCVYFNEIYCEDSTLMLLKTLERCGCTEAYIAGFDGFDGKEKYYLQNYSLEEGENISAELVSKILVSSLNKLHLHFLTPSLYQSALEGK